MATYVRCGSQKVAAFECGITLQTFKNHLTGLYARLDADNVLDALNRLGWIVIPPEALP
jgi:DNA-binding NarL/FixJ family response regulator